jgi:hypothetical protein
MDLLVSCGVEPLDGDAQKNTHRRSRI